MAQHDTQDARLASLLRAAVAARGARDPAAEMRALRNVLALDPANPSALNALGMLALGTRDFAAADSHFTAAANADPAAPPLWLNVANARRQRGDTEGERTALHRILQIDQRHLMATLRLAELHERLGELPQAGVRWGAVLAIVQMMPEAPAALEPIIAHAQRFVLERSAAFGEAVDAGLAPARAAIDPSERRRFDACIDTLLGRRRIYVNECHGMRFPFLPADEFFDRRLTPWLTKIEAQTDAIRAECAALLRGGDAGFEPYVAMDAGTPENIWSGLDHSLDWSAFYLLRYGKREDAAQAACPITTAALDAMPLNDMPGRGPTAFFSILKPRTRLPAHSGVSNARATVHLPLIVPPGCGFRVGGETRKWVEGHAFAFDDTIEHEAWNDSDQLRAVLIFDAWNPHITPVEQDLLRRFFMVADASGHDPGGAATIAD
ncbi:aspartyl/asparaginyl beta-hydroxylase domain-containing protein [Sphingomonas sp. CROZ-RG-20F-R02-07]|uniref:aspartyl/asparaginyl beta-hydroxylase domain-containing protein n=1 Tax=Sphingomonas sp. CROZ-RG-20F-R02-07 TaxID=2914832 RepID=UPI001F566078|nr:aspartyl/asparaginyl beta-hydroxylase domain-containing protein [Sphingomonas sp. CROZ-RG-20F-R02-07]